MKNPQPATCNPQPHSSGQAMILAVLALGGAILGATTIAGLLMTYQLRQVGDFSSSAKAIYAADAGVECGLYAQIKDNSVSCPETPSSDANYTETTDLVNQTIFSQGASGNAHRAFIVLLDSATTTVP